jgi:hypothetical protein
MHAEMQKVLEGLEQNSEDELSNQRAQEYGQVEPAQYRKKKTFSGDDLQNEKQTVQSQQARKQQEIYLA